MTRLARLRPTTLNGWVYAALLVIAGTIEGFLSPSDAPNWVKFGTGILTGLLLYGYWIFVGRGQKPDISGGQ